MAISGEQTSALLATADCLRPRGARNWSLIEAAHALGVEVWLRGVVDQRKSSGGLLEYTSPPRIILNRQSAAPFMRRLSRLDDALIKAHQRFTLAHEIGHWLVYDRFGVGPVNWRSEGANREYRNDEDAVNAFANRLLLPEWQIEMWLARLGDQEGIHVHHLGEWSRTANVSPDAIANRLKDRWNGFGYLRLEVHEERYFPMLEVKWAAFDPELHLANMNTKIRNERLVRMLLASTTDFAVLKDFSFDKKRRFTRTYHVSWLASRGQTKALRPWTVSGIPHLPNYFWTTWSYRAFGRDVNAGMLD